MEVMVDDIVAREPLISDNRKPQLRRLIYKLIEKLRDLKNNEGLSELSETSPDLVEKWQEWFDNFKMHECNDVKRLELQ